MIVVGNYWRIIFLLKLEARLFFHGKSSSLLKGNYALFLNIWSVLSVARLLLIIIAKCRCLYDILLFMIL